MPKHTLPSPINSCWFARDTLSVARELLGARLLVREAGGGYAQYAVVETEAYTADDPACHAYPPALSRQKPSGRAANLYKAPGTAYVYLIYGMYNCLNVVTEPEGVAGAVLFRALQPMHAPPGQKPTKAPPSLRTHGPGRLCKALGITAKRHNGVDLTNSQSPLYLAPGEEISDVGVVQTTRIGISKATEYPWRFYIAGNPWVSAR